MSRSEKLGWLMENVSLSEASLEAIHSHLHPDPELQERYAGFSENTISAYHLPLGLAPNFVVNGQLHVLPMVIEESSVVAAASFAAGFWARHGGFHCRVRDTLKPGQLHLQWKGEKQELERFISKHRQILLGAVAPMTRAMEQRGGGIVDMNLERTAEALPDAFQLLITFRTGDAMGANFINTVLEGIAAKLRQLATAEKLGDRLKVGMAILSNYTPECLVHCQVEAPVGALGAVSGEMDGADFAGAFVRAVDIALHDTYRAVTHNKGIFNGMDAVLMATGNDYRAVEAGAHAYAARDGAYRSLSRAGIEGDLFRFQLELPLALGTVGGLTGSHPLAAASLEILGRPGAEELMCLVASAGLANNFSAVRALVTSGIQKGHMKMHLANILLQLGASQTERETLTRHFEGHTPTHASVRTLLDELRSKAKGP